jgi:ketosteroid isomerase-like protein
MPSSIDTHRAAHDAFNARDWDRMRSIAADDIEFVDHPRGLTLRSVDEFVGWLGEWTGGMSDARVDEPDYLDAGTHSVCRFRGRGVNDGPLGPAQATGRQLDLAFCEVVRVDGGRIVAGEMFYDALSMMAQLGVVEAPAAASP